MAKAAKAKAKRSPKPKTTDKAQSKRFIEAARELGATDTDAFDDAAKMIVTYRPASLDKKSLRSKG
jgi:hypothetical protein